MEAAFRPYPCPTPATSCGDRMAEGKARGWMKKLKRSIGQIGLVRLLATLLFVLAGLYVAANRPPRVRHPARSDAERALYDWRFYRSAERVLQQDDRIVLITYNDDTLLALGKRSPLDRHTLARRRCARSTRCTRARSASTS